MILSVHIRKCGGTSFRKSLETAFGPRVLFDYGDHVGSSWPISLAQRRRRLAEAKSSKGALQVSYQVIHGHFYRQKYAFLDRPLAYITMLRDPVARVVSNYQYLKRNPDRRNPDALIVNALGFSLIEFARHPDNRNLQSQFLQSTDLKSFSAVGLVERYDESLAAFSEVLEVPLTSTEPQNVNPQQTRPEALTVAERAEIENCNLEDMRLYEQAWTRFERLERAC